MGPSSQENRHGWERSQLSISITVYNSVVGTERPASDVDKTVGSKEAEENETM